MRYILFILLLIPILTFGQIEVIKVAEQPNVFESCCQEVIRESWPKYEVDSWYGNPDIRLSTSQTGNVWFSTTLGPRMFYTNISENHRIFRGDSINLIAGGGRTYKWNTDETTRIIKVSPTETTTYSVTIEDDIEHSPERTMILSTTVFVEDRPLSPKSLNVGNDKTICMGSSITLTSSTEETPFTTYLWSTGETTKTITVTPSLSQSYTVTVTDNETTLTDEIFIHVENCK